jgi:Ca2+-binding EF-hand superfamily protein
LDDEMQRIVEAVGKSCLDNHGSLAKAFSLIGRDADGNVRRADVKRFFAEHRVAVRMADRFFDKMAEDRRSSNASEALSICSMNNIRSVFDSLIGDHLEKGDTLGHGRHNVHGLLRPKPRLASIVSLPNADNHHNLVMNQERLRKIVKTITGEAQRRYAWKFEGIERNELQKMFQSYGLCATDANKLFDSIDKERTGEINFKDLGERLPEFLNVKEVPRKHNAATNTRLVRADSIDNETLAQICDHAGDKAAMKFKNMPQAFRLVKRDLENKVDRFEVRNFFRQNGSKTTLADKFFEKLDKKGEGKIDFAEFQNHFRPYIQPGSAPPRAFADSKLESAGLNGSQSNKCSSRNSGNLNQDEATELTQNRFGRFQGTSTYQSSFGDSRTVYRQIAAAGAR